MLTEQKFLDNADAQRAMVHANLEILQQNTIIKEKCLEELEQRSYLLHASIEENTAVLLQTQTDLEMCNNDLEGCRAQRVEMHAIHQFEEETAFATMQQHSELIRETQSSIDFLTQNKHQMMLSIDEMHRTRDSHDLKLEQIRCYGNTLNSAMTELRSGMHMRQR